MAPRNPGAKEGNKQPPPGQDEKPSHGKPAKPQDEKHSHKQPAKPQILRQPDAEEGNKGENKQPPPRQDDNPSHKEPAKKKPQILQQPPIGDGQNLLSRKKLGMTNHPFQILNQTPRENHPPKEPPIPRPQILQQRTRQDNGRPSHKITPGPKLQILGQTPTRNDTDTGSNKDKQSKG